MKLKSKLIKLGREPNKQKGFVNPGIYKGSTMIFKNFKDYLNDINLKDHNNAFYGIHSNPSHKELEDSISNLYGSSDTVITSSGLAALVIPFFTFLKKDDEVLINDSVYNPTRTFCNELLKNYGVKIKYFHPTKKINTFVNNISKKTKLIFLESPGTATFDIIDIPFVTKIAKKYNIVTVLDNTWASPLFCDPFKLGINVVVDAGTKYINGHSDVLIGFVSSDKKTAKQIRTTKNTLGMCPGSEEVYLTLRGLPTLSIRMKEVENNALKLAKKLLQHNLVQNVYHPALPHTLNHYIWKRDFTGSSGLFGFTLKKTYSNKMIERFYNKLKIFRIGYSWGGFESLITFPSLTKRSITKKSLGTLIRIYCGLEDSDDQINDIINALKILK
jgi:cystathionine beta-lyase